MGLAAFVSQSTADLDALAKADPVQARIWAGMPLWAWLAYGLAVGCGLASAIALQLRRRIAISLSIIEVIAVLAQFGYTFCMTDLLALRGAGTLIFPAIILLLAIVQLWLGLSWRKRGILR